MASATSLSAPTVVQSHPLSMEETDVPGKTNQSIPPESTTHHSPPFQSYRDKFIAPATASNLITHAFTQQPKPLYLNHLMDETINPSADAAFIPITSDDKQRIYSRWSQALIVKVYGKIVGYNFLYRKLHEIWKPTDDLILIDLGKDFFLIDFKN